MPIDYSRFDCIGDDDEDDLAQGRDARGGDLDELLQRCLRQLDGQDAAPTSDAGPFSVADDFAQDVASKCSDRSNLQQEARRLLLQRLVIRPGAAGVARALLLEAELHLLASRYRQALVTTLALQLATEGDYAEDYQAPAVALEMVSTYQLGDRDRAVQLRDQLRSMDRSMLSRHLQGRYEGTSEVLELVPQFLDLLKAAEQEDLGTKAQQESTGASAAFRGVRHR